MRWRGDERLSLILLLQRLNEDLGLFGHNNTNIDLYAGTSTGGLIALGLAYGKSIDSVESLYLLSVRRLGSIEDCVKRMLPS
jgi:patatin-like phospholipase/acyl hydrolase